MPSLASSSTAGPGGSATHRGDPLAGRMTIVCTQAESALKWLQSMMQGLPHMDWWVECRLVALRMHMHMHAYQTGSELMSRTNGACSTQPVLKITTGSWAVTVYTCIDTQPNCMTLHPMVRSLDGW